MDLSTSYLGLKLANPFIAAASHLTETVDGVRTLADAGASAVVLPSLFEEQLREEDREVNVRMQAGTESFAEALTYFPALADYQAGPDEYLKLIAQAKQAVKIPVIASLNAAVLEGWIIYAKKLEQAGADAIELNLYALPLDMQQTGESLERDYVATVKAVTTFVRIPVAVKVSPSFTNPAEVFGRMVDAGAKGLVLFNRFYQPDIDLEQLSVEPKLELSTSAELRQIGRASCRERVY
jgi:dihydroorotate dehydrogenase (fumarate)